MWSSAAQELRDATHIIFVGYSLPIADFEFRYMLQKNVTSSAKIDVILTPNSNPDLVANNLKDLLPSKRYLDAFPKNKLWKPCAVALKRRCAYSQNWTARKVLV